MSKAFTDEESSDATAAGRPPVRAARGEERPITPEGFRALEAERLRLLEVERPAAKALAVPAAREAKLKDVEHRLAVVAATLESVRVVPPSPGPRTVAEFGAEVTLAWDDGRVQVVRLVGPDEADAKADRVSVASPLGRALLGLAVGDAFEVERPRGAVGGEVRALR